MFHLRRVLHLSLLGWFHSAGISATAQYTPEWVHDESTEPGLYQAQTMRVNAEGWSFSTGVVNVDTTFYALLYSLDPQGTLVWSDTLMSTVIHELEINSSDELFGTGWNSMGGCVTVKYNMEGTREWLSTFYGGNGLDRGMDLVLGTGGDVYVTGDGVGPGNSTDILALKYGASGDQLWQLYYHATTAYDGDLAKGIAVDQAGNAYITAASRDTVDGSVLILSLDPAGAERWHRRTAPPLYSSGELIAVHGASVITTNYSSGLGTGDVVTTAYDTSGTFLWENVQGIPQRDFPRAMAIGVDGSIYITGSKNIGNSWYHDILTIALNNDGTTRWIRTHDGGVGFDDGTSIVVDVLGRVLVVGNGPDTTMGNRPTIMVLCYDTVGYMNWSTRYAPVGDHCFSGSIGSDGVGGVYVHGHCASDYLTGRLVTLKYDESLSIEDQPTPRTTLHCFPIPVDDQLHFVVNGAEETLGTLAIHGCDGRLALPVTLVPASAVIDVSELADGVYVIRYEGDARPPVVAKVVVQHR